MLAHKRSQMKLPSIFCLLSCFSDNHCLCIPGEPLFKSPPPNSSPERRVLTGILTSLPFLTMLTTSGGGEGKKKKKSSSFYSQHDVSFSNCTRQNSLIAVCFLQCPSSNLLPVVAQKLLHRWFEAQAKTSADAAPPVTSCCA